MAPVSSIVQFTDIKRANRADQDLLVRPLGGSATRWPLGEQLHHVPSTANTSPNRHILATYAAAYARAHLQFLRRVSLSEWFVFNILHSVKVEGVPPQIARRVFTKFGAREAVWQHAARGSVKSRF